MIAIITAARKGSVRLKRKNMMRLCGKPLIQYTFDIMKQLNYPRYCITDDINIKKLAINNGIRVIDDPDQPRDENYYPKFMEHIHKYIKADYYLMLPPTSPIRDISEIKDIINICKESGLKSFYSIKNNGEESGLFFWFHKDNLHNIKKNKKEFYPDYVGIDIDTIEDFEEAKKCLQK